MNNDVASLKDYARVIRRRWRIILGTVVVMLAAVGAYALLWPPVYQGVAEVQIRSLSETTTGQPEGALLDDIETQRYVANSEPVAGAVVADLNLDVSPDEVSSDWVTTEIVPDTQIMRISAKADSPELAARVANAFVEHYLAYRQDQFTGDMAAALKEVENREAEIRKRLAAIDREAASADNAQRQALNRQRNSLEELLGTVTAQVATRATTPTPTAGTIVQQAQADPVPAAPKPLRDGALALVLGLLLGGAIAFTKDHFDETVQDAAGLGRVLPAASVLGSIPHRRRRRGKEDYRKPPDPRSPTTEAYQSLAAQVRGILLGRERGNRVLVTSATRGEGRTMTAMNLAIANARVGLRVLVIDADLRQPDLTARLGLAGRPGLTEILAKGAAATETIVDVDTENLWVLPAGGSPPNPGELLGNPGFAELLVSLSDGVDLVICDCAPASYADPLDVARTVGLVLLVARAGTSRGPAVAGAAEKVGHAATPVLAVCGDVRQGLRGSAS